MSEPTSDVTLAEAREVINRLMSLLGGPNGQRWFGTIQEVLRGIPDWAQSPLTPWCTVETGRYKSAEAMIRRIKRRRHRITSEARKVLDETPYSTDRRTWSLAVISAMALCGERRVTLAEILRRSGEAVGNRAPKMSAPLSAHRVRHPPSRGGRFTSQWKAQYISTV